MWIRVNLASSHQIADYDYTGPFRIRKKTLGEGTGYRKNASYLLPSYDGLRRVTAFDWKDLNNEKLIGSDYAYDDVGNPLNEKFDHDEDRYDNFKYGRDAAMAAVRPSKQARRCEAACTSSPMSAIGTVAQKTIARRR